MNASRLFERFGERSPPLYGQLMVWLVLGCGVFLSFQVGPVPLAGERNVAASLLGFLPESVLTSPWPIPVSRVVFWAAAALWALGRGAPATSWLATAAFTAMVSFHQERLTYVDHVFHLTNQVMLIHALWFHFHGAEIRGARRAGVFRSTPLYPRWASSLSVLAVGLFYGYSGLTKLLASGPGWANGVSLQLWVLLWGDPESVFTRLLLEHRSLAIALSVLTLAAETLALVAVFVPRLRAWVALALLSFHAGAILVFGWAFHANAALVAAIFLPVRRWHRRAAAPTAP